MKTAVATAVAATAVFFHRAVLSTDVFFVRDIFRVYYPVKAYWAQRVAEGSFPAWFPGDGLGQPFVGMLISGAFHPLNALFLVFPLGVALKLNLLVCYPAAILGGWALARRLGVGREAALLAGVAYGLCGFLTGLTNNLLYLEAAATVPWVLWAADRAIEAPSPARVLAAAALLALVGFSGDGQTFAVTGAALVPFALIRGRTARAALAAVAAVALAGALCAAQILPAVATLPESAISAPSGRMTMTWSMHPLLVLDLAFGSIFGGDPGSSASIAIARDVLDTHQTSLWVESMHLGLVVLVLAAAGAAALRRDRRFAVALAGTLALFVLLLGKNGGLYPWMVEWVPFWKAFRYPMKLAPLFLLPVALAAAYGLEALDESLRLRRAAVAAFAAAAALCAIGWLARDAWLPAAWSSVADAAARETLAANTARALGQTALAALAAALAAGLVARTAPRALALTAIAGAHLYAANEPLYLLTDAALLEAPPAFAQVVQRDAAGAVAPARVTDVLDVLPVPELPGHPWADRLAAATARSLSADSQLLWGLSTSNAYLPATSARYRTLVLDQRLWLPRYSAMFATPYIVIPEQTLKGLGGSRDTALADDPQFQLLLLKSPRALPRAYLARPRCVADRAAALEAISRHAVPAGVAIVECGAAADAPAEPATPGTAALTVYAPERVEVAVNANGPAVLVLNDAHYGGWSATIDGQPAEIRPANLAVRSVAVPAGAHTVVFTYRARGLAAGVGVSVTALLLAAAAAVWAQRKSRRENTTTASVRNAAE